MKEQSATIPSGELRLEALVAVPEAATPMRGAVICHPHPQYGGSMYNNVVEAALEAMWRLGMATVRFNFRGVGASSGEYGGGAGEAEDAKAAARFLLAREGVAKRGAVMAGYSFGAAVAMRAGAELDEVDTIAAIALPVGMADFSDLGQSRKRIILVSGDHDEYCPADAIARLAHELGPSASLKLIAGADHFFGGFEGELCDALVELIGTR